MLAIVAVFLFLSALFHWLIISPGFYGRYLNGLEHHRNHFRWVEYSLSSSVMIVLIAMLTGIGEAGEGRDQGSEMQFPGRRGCETAAVFRRRHAPRQAIQASRFSRCSARVLQSIQRSAVGRAW